MGTNLPKSSAAEKKSAGNAGKGTNLNRWFDGAVMEALESYLPKGEVWYAAVYHLIFILTNGEFPISREKDGGTAILEEIRKSIARLRKKGYLETTRREGGRTYYRLRRKD